MRTALIAGASGLVGGFLLKQLLDAPDYDRVVAVGRRPLKISHPKLVSVTAKFTELDKVTEDLSCAAAFCCLGTTIKQAGTPEEFRAIDRGAVLAFAWVARRNGAQSFFTVSSMGSNAHSRFFYNRVKGETEEALAVLAFPTLGIFRPSLLLGPRAEKRIGERIGATVMGWIEPVMVGRWRKYRAIQAEVVARAMLRCSFGATGQGVLVFPSDEIQDLGAGGWSRT